MVRWVALRCVLAVLGTGCDAGDTEVALEITVAPSVRPLVDTLRIRVFDEAGDAVYDETRPRAGTPLELPGGPTLRPESGSDDRSFRIEAEFSGARSQVIRASSRYVEGERRELWLCLDEACLDTTCDALHRCVAGRCVELEVAATEPGELDPARVCDPPDTCPTDDCAGDCRPAKPAVQVSVGDDHACALLEIEGGERELWCWGANDSGQLGVSDPSGGPQLVMLPDATDVSAGTEHTCAIESDGTLWCWGSSANGRLGFDDARAIVATPTQVGGETTWRDVEAGGAHTCAIAMDGALSCFGANAEGQLGDGTQVDALAPVRVAFGWAAVSLGDTHTCALPDPMGPPHCWGDNRLDQLAYIPPDGEPDVERTTTPTALQNEEPFAVVSSGRAHVCAIRMRDRSLHCWGESSDAQLGAAAVLPSSSYVVRVRVADLPEDATWRDVAAGSTHTCGITENDGALRCWGSGDADEGASLGLGAAVAEDVSPSRVATTAEAWRSVSAGRSVTCAIDSIGRLFCWGVDDADQLGVSGTASRFRPTRVCFL